MLCDIRRISGVLLRGHLAIPQSETRYVREIIYGKKRAITNFEIITEEETVTENSTSFVLKNLKVISRKL